MVKFFTELFSKEEANVIVFGAPLGKVSKEALRRIRQASHFIETFDVKMKINLLENTRLCDVGDLKLRSLEEIEERVKEILNLGKIPLALGGSHLITYFAAQVYPLSTKLLVFDAHGDLKDAYEDERRREMDFLKHRSYDIKLNSATWLRRYCEQRVPKNVMLIGLRSCDEDEVEFAEASGMKIFTSVDVRSEIERIKSAIKAFTKRSNVYVSIDADVFDPSIAPAVYHPEPAGIFFDEFREIVDSIEGKLVGIDVAELRPIRGNEITEFLLVRAVFELFRKIA